MSELIYKCFCKATNSEKGEPRYSHNWVLARRDWLKIFPDRFECGDWEIPFEDVSEALVYKTRQGLIPVKILVLATPGGNFQFGVNPWSNPFKHIGIPTKEESIKLKYSAFSIIIRLVLVGYLAYWGWSRWT